MVLNNQSARLQVGDQVPVATGSAVSTVSSGAPIVNSIAYQDTGIILKVTPRVNASGLVLLDVSQEVSQVSTTTTSTLDSPTISQRRVTSSVAVNDGETIALGGLISDSQSTSKNGIPILQDIPVLGFLFGTRSNGGTRTELIALITPRVVRNRFEGRQVTDELRQKLPLLAPTGTTAPAAPVVPPPAFPSR
jgi:general secretion pathway protein D